MVHGQLQRVVRWHVRVGHELSFPDVTTAALPLEPSPDARSKPYYAETSEGKLHPRRRPPHCDEYNRKQDNAPSFRHVGRVAPQPLLRAKFASLLLIGRPEIVHAYAT